MNDLYDLSIAQRATMKEVKSVNGKLIYVLPLVVGGRHRISNIMKLAHSTDSLRKVVDITEVVKIDLRWWIYVIRMTEHGMPIPTTYGDRAAPPLAVQGDSDAAGGSFVCEGACAIIKWPKLINIDGMASCCNLNCVATCYTSVLLWTRTGESHVLQG